MLFGKKIVVVMPAYNAELTLRQTYDEIPMDYIDEVILVDDGSTDGTGETDTDRTDDVIPQVRTADLIQHVEQDLYGAYAVLDHDRSPVVPGADALEPADLEQLPPPAGGTGLRNLLYALEWIVFGGFAGFVWWRYVRDVTREGRGEAAEQESSSGPPVPSGT